LIVGQYIVTANNHDFTTTTQGDFGLGDDTLLVLGVNGLLQGCAQHRVEDGAEQAIETAT